MTVSRVINTCVLIEIDGRFVLTDPYFASQWFFRTNEPIGLRLPVDGATFLGRQLVMDAAGALAAAKALGAPALVPIHHSELPVPGLLRCPSGLDELQRLAEREPDVRIYTAPTGVGVPIDVDRPV